MYPRRAALGRLSFNAFLALRHGLKEQLMFFRSETTIRSRKPSHLVRNRGEAATDRLFSGF